MSDYLQSIHGPADLKRFSNSELVELAAEIRQFLLKTVAHTGGHLAPNLGVVELTLALHAIFDSPRDKIVWDVGHQSYVHKILTGRYDQFQTLRQFGGLSGFPKPEESEHDAFATGHSSTSISAALGIAKARDLAGENHKVVAVIGDGSLTGGMAFEGLNQLGHLQTDMIVVLNDNEMSIAKNVGALSRYLNRLRMNPKLRRLKSDIQELIRKIPRVGKVTVEYLSKLEDSLTYLVIPGMFFEELGITYLGPVNGHDIAELKVSLRDAANRGGPVLIHVLTVKGKGYELAERNPQRFHGTGPFELANGRKTEEPSALSYTEVFSRCIVDLAKSEPKIIAVTAAMADGTGLLNFSKHFPKRFFDVGIAEEHAVTFAAGLAKQGFHPVVAIYSTFLQRAYDQIIHDVCLQNLPVVFMLDRAGLVGADGPTHHGVFDLSFLRHIPNMTVMAPKDAAEFQDMLYTALHTNGPVAIRYPRRAGLTLEDALAYVPLPLGTAEILLEGKDIAIVAIGSMVSPALEAAKLLKKSGIDCTVVNARFVKPLDQALLLSLLPNHSKIITVEENAVAGGFGSAVAEFLTGQGVTGVRLKALGIPDQFIAHGSTEILLAQCGLDAEGICRAVRELNLPAIGIRASL
ncbi:1-deoxy-D-xylulose-5-phosphate synthase [Hydrogenispora ethanolica]|uniref:1-deoxy-D-xylulose-5-phosphate synthase n=1 Tax=Hydrogenispora ethanolica TaxID=1082276 RepID=A0A4R1RFK8_HYDET|nr:1-deoxy-D-xylulose-5-phosphate synthase [Hydrogenispora ethanolica]TCL64744.1 1-deoxy-D-xylulose-5-phosphate synthase [Hydrogenispora ethanolica]